MYNLGMSNHPELIFIFKYLNISTTQFVGKEPPNIQDVPGKCCLSEIKRDVFCSVSFAHFLTRLKRNYFGLHLNLFEIK